MDYTALNIRSCAKRITDLTHIAFDLGLFFNNMGNMSIVPVGEDDHGRKVYLDYFVQYDNNLMPIRFSKPFKLTDKEIEFTTTLIDDGENFVIGNTIYDETPEVLVFDKRKLLKMVNMVE